MLAMILVYKIQMVEQQKLSLITSTIILYT